MESFSKNSSDCIVGHFRAHERSPEDLETIYEELVHIRALSHLSTTVKRELANVIVFESHPRSATVRKSGSNESPFSQLLSNQMRCDTEFNCH